MKFKSYVPLVNKYEGFILISGLIISSAIALIIIPGLAFLLFKFVAFIFVVGTIGVVIFEITTS